MIRTLETATFYGIIFLIGALIGGIGTFLFRSGHELEAVVFCAASYSVMGFVIGARHTAQKYAYTPPEEACAEEGYGGLTVRRRV